MRVEERCPCHGWRLVSPGQVSYVAVVPGDSEGQIIDRAVDEARAFFGGTGPLELVSEIYVRRTNDDEAGEWLGLIEIRQTGWGWAR